VVVIGLGRFGSSLARTLSGRGHEVLGLDTDMRKVEAAAEFVTQATQVDATDEGALIELGVRDFDIGVVAIGGDIKSSIMIALLLKKLGVKRVVGKAYDELHGEILAKIGADTVVYPERDTGMRIAHTLMIPCAEDYTEVMPGYGVAKIAVPKPLAGKHLGDVDLKGRFGVSVLMLRRKKEVIVNPSRHEVVGDGDILILAGRDEDLEAMRGVIG
jgi:trk system potassium uptake protein TrkA